MWLGRPTSHDWTWRHLPIMLALSDGLLHGEQVDLLGPNHQVRYRMSSDLLHFRVTLDRGGAYVMLYGFYN